MSHPGALPRPKTLQLEIDAEHVALLESAIREVRSRYCSRDVEQAVCVAWEAALQKARKREAERIGFRRHPL